ncbi:MAG: TetR/AcrR family transcriptional regulator [Bacteroidota bacterium]
MKAGIKKSRRNAIIKAAKSVFFERGFARTNISEICSQAGISRTTLYSYFESKENIYLAVVFQAFQKFLDHFPPQTGENGLDRILSLSKAYIDFAQNFPQHYSLILDFYSISREEKLKQTETQKLLKQSEYFEKARKLSELPLNQLLQVISRGQKDSSIQKEIPAHIHMLNIWAYLRGIAELSGEWKQQDLHPEGIILDTIKALLK